MTISERRMEFALKAMEFMNWSGDPEHVKLCAGACWIIAEAMVEAGDKGLTLPEWGNAQGILYDAEAGDAM